MNTECLLNQTEWLHKGLNPIFQNLL